MKKCRHCGAEIQDDANFCPNCGANQYGDQVNVPPESQAKEAPQGQSERPYEQGATASASDNQETTPRMLKAAKIVCYAGIGASILGVGLGIPGIVCGIVALNLDKSKKTKDLAIWSIVVGVVFTIIWCIVTCYLSVQFHNKYAQYFNSEQVYY